VRSGDRGFEVTDAEVTADALRLRFDRRPLR
jgi:hypothetical protein